MAVRNSPGSYVVSFAILHELTAIVPLFGLTWAFHHYRWLPPWFAEGKWVVDGVEKIGRWFRRRGWIAANEEAEIEERTRAGNARTFEKKEDRVSNVWNTGEDVGRLVVEIGTAYAMVKFLLPLRIVLSAFWAPGFAKLCIVPLGRAARSMWSKQGTRL